MKRDMDLIRDIMIYLEDNLTPGKPIQSTQIPLCGDSDEEYRVFSEHIRLLLDAELIDASEVTLKGFTIYDIQRITSNGHDFLDSLRNNIVWNKTKEAAGKVGGYTISILMDLGKEYIKKQVGL